MNNRWRTIDIVIASIIAVAFGVIFWAWNLLWSAPTARSPSSAARPGAPLRRLAGPGRARRADHPQAGRGALHRDPRLAGLGRARRQWGWHRHRCRARSRASAPSWPSRPSLYRSWKLPAALLAGAADRGQRRAVSTPSSGTPARPVGPPDPVRRCSPSSAARSSRAWAAGRWSGRWPRPACWTASPPAASGRWSDTMARGRPARVRVAARRPPRLGRARRRPAHRARRAGAPARVPPGPARAPCSPRWPGCCPTTRASPRARSRSTGWTRARPANGSASSSRTRRPSW